jgi:hypothetical protein
MSGIKAKLTYDELKFCELHNVDPNSVLDASGMSQKVYRAIMSENGWVLAAKVTPCNRGAHRLRTGGGHCAVCDPKKIRYRSRYSETGFVYLASPISRPDIVKIGLSNDINKRKSSLNSDVYAGFTDWKIKNSFKVNNVGAIEHEIQKKLSRYKYSTTYYTKGKLQTAQELFLCSHTLALKAIDEIIGEKGTQKQSKSKKESTFNRNSSNDDEQKIKKASTRLKSIVEVDRRSNQTRPNFKKQEPPKKQINIEGNNIQTPSSSNLKQNISKNKIEPDHDEFARSSFNTVKATDEKNLVQAEQTDDIKSVLLSIVIYYLPLVLLSYWVLTIMPNQITNIPLRLSIYVVSCIIGYLLVLRFMFIAKVRQGSFLDSLVSILIAPFALVASMTLVFLPFLRIVVLLFVAIF